MLAVLRMKSLIDIPESPREAARLIATRLDHVGEMVGVNRPGVFTLHQQGLLFEAIGHAHAIAAGRSIGHSRFGECLNELIRSLDQLLETGVKELEKKQEQQIGMLGATVAEALYFGSGHNFTVGQESHRNRFVPRESQY